MSASAPAADQRAELRRDQIRSAAADCFRRHGFHGSSIAQISKAAGMSPGHIYHYFENKEAIIADIVAQDVKRALTLMDRLSSADDVLDETIARMAEGVAEHNDPDRAALRLEIAAEAARNPAVAAIVRAADARIRAGLAQPIRRARTARGFDDSDAFVAGVVNMLAAMFEGLQIRAVRNPELVRAHVLQLYRQAMLALLTGPAKF